MTAPDNTDLYQAAIVAFTLVANADGQVHVAELMKLVNIFKAHGVFKEISPEQIQKDIFDLVKELNEDFEKEKLPQTLSVISKVKGDAKARELIIKIARQTLMADDRILPSEEKIVADIHRTLGVSEEL